MEEAVNLGILSLIPVVLFLVVAIWTKKCVSAILLAGLSGYILVYKAGFIQASLDALIDACCDWDNNYIIVVCILFGCLVQLLRESRGAEAVSEFARKYVKSDKQVLLIAWLAGVIIFIDDYLSILAVGNSLLPLADEKKTPREMLCYVLNTCSAPMCVIVPVSAWFVFFAGVFEASPETAVLGDTGAAVYYHSMPYFFYPFLCVIMVPFVIYLPKLGGMKRAYERVEQTGKLWGPNSDLMNSEAALTETAAEESGEAKGTPHIWAFVVPMAVVIGIGIWQGDMLWGAVFGLLACLVLFVPTKIMSLDTYLECCYKGAEDMLFIALVLESSLFYRTAIAETGLSDYVIETVGPLMSAGLLPAITFVVLGLLCFITSNIWSMPAIFTPVVLPLAASIGCSIPLTLGAIMSAAILGAQSCFYSDVTLLSASTSKIHNLEYTLAQMPYVLICSAICLVGFVVCGFVM